MASDHELIQIVDAALAEANRKAGAWLACRAGCFECCLGPFPITQLDAVRLRKGLAQLETRDPGRAARVRARVRTAPEEVNEEQDSGDPCPVLDPETGRCDLYEARPLTCRTFGPALRWSGEAIGVCELNFQGATDEEIAACEVEIEAGDLERELLAKLPEGETTVAFALADAISGQPIPAAPSFTP